MVGLSWDMDYKCSQDMLFSEAFIKNPSHTLIPLWRPHYLPNVCLRWRTTLSLTVLKDLFRLCERIPFYLSGFWSSRGAHIRPLTLLSFLSLGKHPPTSIFRCTVIQTLFYFAIEVKIKVYHYLITIESKYICYLLHLYTWKLSRYFVVCYHLYRKIWK